MRPSHLCPPFALVVALAAGTAAPASPRPQRIVSVNLCADQYVLALADRGQIAGLTKNATNPDMSAAAGDAAGLPLLGASAEGLLAARPDLVVGMGGERVTAVAAAAGQTSRTLDLGMATNIADIVAQVRAVAAATGHPARGEKLVADMERQLASVPRPGRGRIVAHYQRRGYLTGTGTLVDDLIRGVGLVNLAARLGKPALSRLSVEELIAARPDFILVETGTERVADQGTEMLHHPALAAIPRVRLPQAWTVCGGPSYVRAAKSLAGELARLGDQRR
jgi:iron complex transport system substrate-binding protein